MASTCAPAPWRRRLPGWSLTQQSALSHARTCPHTHVRATPWRACTCARPQACASITRKSKGEDATQHAACHECVLRVWDARLMNTCSRAKCACCVGRHTIPLSGCKLFSTTSVCTTAGDMLWQMRPNNRIIVVRARLHILHKDKPRWRHLRCPHGEHGPLKRHNMPLEHCGRVSRQCRIPTQI